MPDKSIGSGLRWSFVAGIGVIAWAFSGSPAVPAAQTEGPPFLFVHEFYGSGGYQDPHAKLNAQEGMMNGVTVWPPVESAAANLLDSTGGVILRLAGSPKVAGVSTEEISRHVAALSLFPGAGSGLQLFWNLMPEWDQSGGDWVPQGRPRYSGLSRRDAHGLFLAHYQRLHPALTERLQFSRPLDRSYRLAAITDHSPNVFYGYELGAELQMLERGIDELGDLSTGVAHLRGAARQYGKPWGIDISTWRTSTNGATAFDGSGKLSSGWSASYLEHLYYLAFAAGAQIIHNEAATYRNASGSLNPHGEVTKRFADFALRRHPDIGQPTVNMALLVDHFAGFDPRHGVNNQTAAVWYQDIPYSDGDHMIDNLLRASYPDHWLHGLTPGAPFADGNGIPDPSAFLHFLSLGGDPRPYEPMPTTRWGDNIDVLTNRASLDTLSSYKVILVAGDMAIDDALRRSLEAWVANGGVLVLNVAQMREQVPDLAGVEITSQTPRTSVSSRWISNFGVQREETFYYLPVAPRNAEVLAVSDTGDPLITSHRAGLGEVILTTPLFLQSRNKDRLVEVGVQLVDRLMRRFEPVQILGPPIEYVIGRPAGKVVVTLANHTGSAWSGQIVAPRAVLAGATEYISDTALPVTESGSQTAVPVQVPRYGIRIIGINQDSTVSKRAQRSPRRSNQ